MEPGPLGFSVPSELLRADDAGAVSPGPTRDEEAGPGRVAVDRALLACAAAWTAGGLSAAALPGGWSLLPAAVLGVTAATLVVRRRPLAPLTSQLARGASRGAGMTALGAVGCGAVTLPLVAHAWLVHHHAGASPGVAAAAGALIAGVALAVTSRPSVPLERGLAIATGGIALSGVLWGLGALADPLRVAAWLLAGGTLAVAAGSTAQLVVARGARSDPPRLAGIAAATAWGTGLVAVVAASAAARGWGQRAPHLLAAPLAIGAALYVWRTLADVRADIRPPVESAGTPSDQAPPALDIHGLCFRYGTHQVLFDVDLRVQQGEVLALLGTNGAGKSTLLRALSGLDHPTRGTIRLFGEDTTYLEAEQIVRLGVALLAGGRMTFPGLTVRENLRIAAGGEASRVRAALGTFPSLSERADQRAGTLSGGEQQMLALARVLVTAPRLLLIDELTLGLAPRIVEQLLASVREMNRRGTTIVIVEQSFNLAAALAERAVFLERGAVRFDGPMAELLTRDDLLRPVFLDRQA